MATPITELLPYGPENILTVWDRTPHHVREQGWSWYCDANAIAFEIAETHGYSLEAVAGVIAVLSPTLNWDTNVLAAREFVETGYTQWQTGTNNWKAAQCLLGHFDAIRGRKVHAFWKAIVNPYGDDIPVIDRHALAVYLGHSVPDREQGVLQRKGARDIIERAYVRAARSANVPVHVIQAATWCQWRIEKGFAQ